MKTKNPIKEDEEYYMSDEDYKEFQKDRIIKTITKDIESRKKLSNREKRRK